MMYNYEERISGQASINMFNDILETTYWIFLVIFGIEALLKIIGMGFILEEGSYLRGGWNWLQFLIVVLGIAPYLGYL